MDKLTIGKMAKLNGVSPQTLRLYDRIKLLNPARLIPKQDTGTTILNNAPSLT